MITGDWLMKGFILFYALTTLVYAYEGNVPKALYFGGSVILSVGVLWMK